MTLVIHFIAPKNGPVVSTHKTSFVMFLIAAWHNSHSNPIWGRSYIRHTIVFLMEVAIQSPEAWFWTVTPPICIPEVIVQNF